MKVVFFILVGIFMLILFLLIGIKFKVMCLLHSKNRSVYYALNHKLFSVVQGKAIVLDDGGFSVVFHKNRIIPKTRKDGFGVQLAMEILSSFKIEHLEIYIDTVRIGDAMTTALLHGGIGSLSGIISAILKNNNISTDIHVVNEKDSQDFTMAIDLNIKISLWKFIGAYWKANKKYNSNYIKEKKYV